MKEPSYNKSLEYHYCGRHVLALQDGAAELKDVVENLQLSVVWCSRHKQWEAHWLRIGDVALVAQKVIPYH